MWSESLRKFLFEPQYVVGFVGILFAAVIPPFHNLQKSFLPPAVLLPSAADAGRLQ
jgi:hypothetical protein